MAVDKDSEGKTPHRPHSSVKNLSRGRNKIFSTEVGDGSQSPSTQSLSATRLRGIINDVKEQYQTCIKVMDKTTDMKTLQGEFKKFRDILLTTEVPEYLKDKFESAKKVYTDSLKENYSKNHKRIWEGSKKTLDVDYNDNKPPKAKRPN